jgi:hypothetical protein
VDQHKVKPIVRDMVKREADKRGIPAGELISDAFTPTNSANELSQEEQTANELSQEEKPAEQKPEGEGFTLNTYIQLMAMQNLGLIPKQNQRPPIQDIRDMLDLQASLTPKTSDFGRYIGYHNDMEKIEKSEKSDKLPLSDLTQIALAQAIGNLSNPQIIAGLCSIISQRKG